METCKVVYGKAFDVLKVAHGAEIDFGDLGSVEERLEAITLYEVKSTNRANVGNDFANYFFSLSTAELLVSQSLGEQFRFVLVHTLNGTVIERTLSQLLQQASGIYPSWSIRLGPASVDD